MSSIVEFRVERYEPPVPFSADLATKGSAPGIIIADGDVIDGSHYPIHTEMLRCYVKLTNLSSVTGLVMTWFNDDTGFPIMQWRVKNINQSWEWVDFWSTLGRLAPGEQPTPGGDSFVENILSLAEIDHNGNYAVAVATEGENEYLRQTAVLHFSVANIDTPPPPVVQKHEIRIRYREGLFGVADRLAQKSPTLISKIAGLLPNNFVVQEVYADTLNNEIIIRIDENGSQVIPVLVVVAIVAVIVAVIAVFYLGYVYSENAVLKATGEAQQAAQDEMEQVILDPTLTEEQKIAKIREILARTPNVVIPPPGGPGSLGDIAGIVKWGVIGLIAVAALNLIPRRGK